MTVKRALPGKRACTVLGCMFALCFVLSITGCSGDPVEYHECQPTRVRGCLCDGSEPGLQYCSAQYEWSMCECGEPDAAGGDFGLDQTPDGLTDMAQTDAAPDGEEVDVADVMVSDLGETAEIDAEVEEPDAEVEVEDACSPTLACHDDQNLWSFDCLGDPLEMAENCVASGMVCKTDSECCSAHADELCDGADLYAVDSCDNLEDVVEYCGDAFDCTTDSCEVDHCQNLPDCSAAECVANISECQCQPVDDSLTCGDATTGNLTSSSPDATNVLTDYDDDGNICRFGNPEETLLTGNEVVYVFNYTGGESSRTVYVELRTTTCGPGPVAVILDGAFTPCDPDQCVIPITETFT